MGGSYMIDINRLYIVTYVFPRVKVPDRFVFVHVDSGQSYAVDREQFIVALNNPNNYFFNWDKNGYTQGSLDLWVEKVSSGRQNIDRSAVFICFKVKDYPTILGKKDYYYCVAEDGLAKGFLTDVDLKDLHRVNRLANASVDKNFVVRLNSGSLLTYTPEEYNNYLRWKESQGILNNNKSILGRKKSINKFDLVEDKLDERQREYLQKKKNSGRYKGMY